MVRSLSRALLASVSLLLAGCGTYVPDIQEFPGSRVEGQLLVQAIVRSVQCEIRSSVSYVIDQDLKLTRVNHGVRNAPWLDDWGVQVTLTLVVQENSGLSPSVLWTPAHQTVFSLGGSANLSATATRTSTLSYFYTVQELYKLGPCPAKDNAGAPAGSPLVQSDLKLRDWLLSAVLANATGTISVPAAGDATDALSHEVAFNVVTSATVNPAWTLTHVNVNQGGNLLSAGRERTHTLSMTFGPFDPAARQLVGAAATNYVASQIGAAAHPLRRGL